MLYRYIYLSTAIEPMTEADVEQILAASRRNNTPVEITGLLIYHQGHFLQVIEGPKAAVNTCIARIKRDPRHDAIFRLGSGPAERRAFPDWRMGFARPEDLAGDVRFAALDLHELAGPDSPARSDVPDVRRAIRTFLEGFRFLRAPEHQAG
jgi:hypothetical protein